MNCTKSFKKWFTTHIHTPHYIRQKYMFWIISRRTHISSVHLVLFKATKQKISATMLQLHPEGSSVPYFFFENWFKTEKKISRKPILTFYTPKFSESLTFWLWELFCSASHVHFLWATWWNHYSIHPQRHTYNWENALGVVVCMAIAIRINNSHTFICSILDSTIYILLLL